MVIDISYQQSKRKGMKRKSTNDKACISFRKVNTKMYFDFSITCTGIAAVLLRENNTVLSKLSEIITSEVDTCNQSWYMRKLNTHNSVAFSPAPSKQENGEFWDGSSPWIFVLFGFASCHQFSTFHVVSTVLYYTNTAAALQVSVYQAMFTWNSTADSIIL